MCDLFKKDGSFVSSTMEGALNIGRGRSEYTEQDVMNFDIKDFGRSECRLTDLTVK